MARNVDVRALGAQRRAWHDLSGDDEFDFRADGEGLRPDDPLAGREIEFLAKYEIEENDTIRVQPCISPVWDTAIAMVSLEEAGLGSGASGAGAQRNAGCWTIRFSGPAIGR